MYSWSPSDLISIFLGLSKGHANPPHTKKGKAGPVSRRSQISIATGRRGFREENLSGSPKAEALAGAVVE